MNSVFSFLMRVFTSGDVLAWGRVLVEVFDYMIKASAAYAQTDDGRKEWEDVVTRFEVAVNNQANGETVSYAVQSAPETPQPTSKGKRRFPVQE